MFYVDNIRATGNRKNKLHKRKNRHSDIPK